MTTPNITNGHVTTKSSLGSLHECKHKRDDRRGVATKHALVILSTPIKDKIVHTLRKELSKNFKRIIQNSVKQDFLVFLHSQSTGCCFGYLPGVVHWQERGEVDVLQGPVNGHTVHCCHRPPASRERQPLSMSSLSMGGLCHSNRHFMGISNPSMGRHCHSIKQHLSISCFSMGRLCHSPAGLSWATLQWAGFDISQGKYGG